MRHHRIKLMSVCTVVLLIFMLATASAAPKVKVWVVTALPADTDWYGTFGNDVNDSGTIGGGWVDADGGNHAAYWYRGDYYDLADEIGVPEDQEGGTSNVLSINNHGLMGGVATSDDGDQVAVLWDVKHGEVYDLDPGGDYIASLVNGVNARGDATGIAVRLYTDPDGVSTYIEQPYLWPKNDDGLELPVGTGVGGTGRGVNASGVVAGAYYPPHDYARAALWTKDGDDYEMTDLHALLDDDTLLGSEATDVDENGRVAGIAFGIGDAGLFFYSWTWKANDGFDVLDDDGEGMSFAWKVNGGYVAGSVGVLGYSPSSPAVWDRGELEILPNLDDLYYAEASSVNQSGLVVGYALTESFGGPYGWYAEKK